ncbi:neuromedin-U isoform X2 [Pleurodeles waltl]|uniref:neuromedin-U isoform X2 n=1 Tax=Pleurodeles waltl TaxID=8319 RepID=UPI0037099F9A
MRTTGCRHPARQSPHGGSSLPRMLLPSPACSAPLLLVLLFAYCLGACGGVPFPAEVRQAEQELQLWNEIDEACSNFLSTEPQPQASSALEEICFTVVGLLQKSQALNGKDNTKRFLFHYSKTHDSGSSDTMEELQGPGGIQSRGYFLFRPRNGRRSAGFR